MVSVQANNAPPRHLTADAAYAGSASADHVPRVVPVSVETFLRAATPFRLLSPEALRWLAIHLEPRRADRGEALVREGEAGDALYILRSGSVQVIVADPEAPGGARELAQLGPGDAFGEQSLLSGDPRAATVRALEPVELYRLAVAEFETARRMFPDQFRIFFTLAMRRQRPRRITTWTIAREPDGAHAILKNTRTATYLRLSEPATFLWDQMDGRNTVRDLTRAYLMRYGSFDIDEVLSVMERLHLAGFVEIQALDRRGAPAHLGGRPRLSPMRLISQYVSLPYVDRGASILYASLYRHLMTWPAQIVFLLLTVLGAVVFTRMFFWHGLPLRSAGHPLGIVAIGIGGLAIQVVMHEIGHAATCKHFGREVRRAGVGWYLFMPVAFVDTSDIWMAGRWPRIAVSIAGPYTNLVLSGVASLAVPFAAPGMAAAIAHFALVGYVLALMNLNPLIQYDGYYVLMDWLAIPNLRARALVVIGDLVSGRPSAVVDARLRRLLGVYGALALVYTTIITYAILAGYHRYLEAGASQLMPHSWAVAIGWIVAGLMAWLIVRGAWHDLHLRRSSLSGQVDSDAVSSPSARQV